MLVKQNLPPVYAVQAKPHVEIPSVDEVIVLTVVSVSYAANLIVY